MDATMIDSKELVRQLLGSRITCRLTNGHIVKGRLVCLDRLMNLILADCTCEHTICSSHYTQETNPPVYGTSVRRLMQAMVPSMLVASVHVDDTATYDQAVQKCRRIVQQQQQQQRHCDNAGDSGLPDAAGGGGVGDK